MSSSTNSGTTFSETLSENLSQSKLDSVKKQAASALATQSELASREKLLLSKLQSQSAAGASKIDMDQTTTQINALTDARAEIQNLLLSLATTLHSQVAETRGDLVDEMTVSGVMENELNNAKKNMNSLLDVKNNKLRMVEINTYYGKRYQAHTSLMKLIIFICVPLLLLAVLGKKGTIGSDLAKSLSGIIIAIGIVLVIARVYDLSRRDNMNYDEYNFWGIDDPDANNPTVWQYDKQQLEGAKADIESEYDDLTNSMSLGCMGELCCDDGTSWNGSKCVTTGDVTESFQGGVSASNPPSGGVAVAASPFSD